MHTTLNNTEKNAYIGSAKKNKNKQSPSKNVKFEEVKN
jgi:hypothetical protein